MGMVSEVSGNICGKKRALGLMEWRPLDGLSSEAPASLSSCDAPWSEVEVRSCALSAMALDPGCPLRVF